LTLRNAGTDSASGARLPHVKVCVGARSRAKQRTAADSQIPHGKSANYVGQYQASDADAAIRLAIKKFEIDAEHRSCVALGRS